MTQSDRENSSIYLIVPKNDPECCMFQGTITQFQDCFASNSYATVEEHELCMKLFAEHISMNCEVYKRL